MINGKCGYVGIKCYSLIPSFAFMRRPRLGAVTAVNCSRRFMHAFLVKLLLPNLQRAPMSLHVCTFFCFFFFAAESWAQKTNCCNGCSKNTGNACKESVLRTDYVQKIFRVLKNWDKPDPVFWTTIPTSEYRWMCEIPRCCLQHCVARSALRKWHCCCVWLKQLVPETQLDLKLITSNVWISADII